MTEKYCIALPDLGVLGERLKKQGERWDATQMHRFMAGSWVDRTINLSVQTNLGCPMASLLQTFIRDILEYL